MRYRVALIGLLVVVVGMSIAGPLAVSSASGDRVTWLDPPGKPDQVGTLADPAPSAESGAAARVPALEPPADPASIKASGASLFGWALLDRSTSQITGSRNSDTVTNTVESMIKPWIVADFLRRLGEDGMEPTPEALEELTLVIVDSHDPLTEKYYRIGGSDAVVRRLISTCDLTRVTIKTTLWSWTTMTPRDAALYGECLGDGRAAGPRWTAWVLDAMKAVRGDITEQVGGAAQGGRWGIVDALPPDLARDTSIKNGWTLYHDGWHVNCLAVHPQWTLSVMVRTWGLQDAARVCRSVTQRLLVP